MDDFTSYYHFLLSCKNIDDIIWNWLTCLLPLEISNGKRLPFEHELQSCVLQYKSNFCKYQEYKCLDQFHIHPFIIDNNDCITIQYIKYSFNLLYIIPFLFKDYLEISSIPILSTQREQSISILLQINLSLLFDYSWNNNWKNFFSNIIPHIQTIIHHSSIPHLVRSSCASWFRLLLSLHENQRMIFLQNKKNNESPDSIIDSLHSIKHNTNNNTNTNDNIIQYSDILDKSINFFSLQHTFQSLMDILQYPPPSKESNSITLTINQRIIRKCGHLLSNCLLKSNGLIIAIQYFIENNAISENKLIDICNKIICKKPSFISETEWIQNYGLQVIPLLITTSLNNDYSLKSKVLWSITMKLLENNKILGLEYILKPILLPLYIYKDINSIGNIYNNENINNITEKDMNICIQCLWKLLCLHYPSQDIYEIISPLIPSIFQLYCFIINTVLNIKQKVIDILKSYFTTCEESSAMFKTLIYPISYKTLKPWNLYCTFAAGDSGGVIIKSVQDKQRNTYHEAECITKLIKQCNNNDLQGNLFIELMNELQLVPETDERYLVVFQWLVQMLDEFGESILTNIIQVCTFLKAMLKSKDEKILTLSLGIISALLSGTLKLKQEEIILIYDLEPELEIIELSYPNISELAGELRTKILVNDKQSWVVSDNDTNRENNNNNNNNIEELEQILKDLSDPLLPVRGHGLIALRRLVLSRNPDADANLQKILTIFKNQLDDNDTYIYLSAINGLMALGDVYPKEIIPILSNQVIESNRKVEQRLKVNEALLKIAQRCGDTLSFHVKPLIHCFLLSCKDKDSTIRASGLSNIAELCKMLCYGLHPYIQEIIECVYSLSLFDKEIEVKRGCIYVIYLLLEGLGIDSFIIIPEHFNKIQNIIKNYITDNDTVTVYHAENAQKYIKDIITYKPKEKKTILHIK